jgi:hypothetical protein
VAKGPHESWPLRHNGHGSPVRATRSGVEVRSPRRCYARSRLRSARHGCLQSTPAAAATDSASIPSLTSAQPSTQAATARCTLPLQRRTTFALQRNSPSSQPKSGDSVAGGSQAGGADGGAAQSCALAETLGRSTTRPSARQRVAHVPRLSHGQAVVAATRASRDTITSPPSQRARPSGQSTRSSCMLEDDGAGPPALPAAPSQPRWQPARTASAERTRAERMTGIYHRPSAGAQKPAPSATASRSATFGP